MAWFSEAARAEIYSRGTWRDPGNGWPSSSGGMSEVPVSTSANCGPTEFQNTHLKDDRIRTDRRIEERRRGNISVGKPDEIDNVRGLE